MKIELLRTRQVRMTGPRRDQSPFLGSRNLRSLDRQILLPIGPVAILDPQGNRRANGLAAPNARKNLRAILLNLLPAAAAITKLPAVQFVIDEIDADRQGCRQARDKR